MKIDLIIKRSVINATINNKEAVHTGCRKFFKQIIIGASSSFLTFFGLAKASTGYLSATGVTTGHPQKESLVLELASFPQDFPHFKQAQKPHLS